MKLNNTPLIDGKQATLKIDNYDLSHYEDLINIRLLPMYDVNKNNITFPVNYLDNYTTEYKEMPLELTEGLFDYQKVCVKIGWIKERYCFFLEPGLGKTLILGELARQIHASTDGKIILCIPLNVISQFEEMMSFFPDFPEYEHFHRKNLEAWCKDENSKTRIAFVNHEYFIQERTLENVAAFLIDESSIFKGGVGGNGKISTNIIKATKEVRYKFAASGTPAPNDRVEYAIHALFMELVRSEKEFYGQFFVNKDNNYVLRKHATEPFYRYLSTWSIFIRNPKVYGFEDNLKDVLPWQEIHTPVELTKEQENFIKRFDIFVQGSKHSLYTSKKLSKHGLKQRSKLSQVSKGFMYDNGKTHKIETNKPDAIVDICWQHKDEQIIIWTVFDEEGDILHDRLKNEGYNVVHLTGKTKEEDRLKYIEQFRHNEIQIMISKPRILGFGLNLQYCHIAIFSGLQDSFELYFQAIKRVHRYGQDKQVLIYLPYTIYEEMILQNVLNKEATVKEDFDYQEKLYAVSLMEELKEFLMSDNYQPVAKQKVQHNPIITDDYQIYHDDSIKVMMEVKNGKSYGLLKPNSVDFSVFSPPFMGDIYTYTNDPADMGNSRGAGATGGLDEFMLQFRFFLEGMKIVTKPGRLMAMHLEDVPLRKGMDGNVGLYDFVGQAVQTANEVGWVLVAKIPIIKNQQMQSIVKHVSNLTMTNMEKDRVRIAPAMNGYLCLFKKPGENLVPISDLAKCNDCNWQGYADNLIGYDTNSKRDYKSMTNYESNFAYCPECNSTNVDIFYEMDGNKWIIYAEGVWPENGFNDNYEELSKIPRDERWNDMVQTALGVWWDITESDTLQKLTKEEEDADKHLCPLPQSIARRAIEMYTNPGELVFTPFLGIGTEVNEAIKLNRKGIGIELKAEYFLKAGDNLSKTSNSVEKVAMF